MPQRSPAIICLMLSCLLGTTVGLSAVDQLHWAWSGGVSHEGATIVCQTVASSTQVVLTVSPNPDLSSPVYTSPAQSTDNENVLRFSTGTTLTANTVYYYGISVDGTLEQTLNDAQNSSDPYTGKFTTLPTPGTAHSFAVTFGACLRSGAIGNEILFDTMKAEDPLFWLCSGDFHYSDIDTNDPARYRSGIISRLVASGAGTKLAALSRSTAFSYIWDDHDFGPNNSTGAGVTNSYKQAAHLVYRQLVPYHDLPLAGDAAFVAGEEPIAQAFTVGRVRFIFTDLRSESTGSIGAGETLLGAEQKAWFKRELLAANGRHASIVWLTSVPWNGASQGGGGDRWQYLPDERTEIADFIVDNDIQGFCAIAGDMHGVAIDDGTNTDFTTAGSGPGFPLFHAAPLRNTTSYKAGPYSEGQATEIAAYGLLSIADGGDALALTMTAKDDAGATITATADNPGNPITLTTTWSHPLLSTTVPADGASGIAGNADLQLTFSEDVTAGSGSLTIARRDNGQVVHTIAASDGGVVITGSTVTITLPSALAGDTAYSLSIAGDFVRDLSANPNPAMVSMTSLDHHPWVFTTAAASDTTPPAAPTSLRATVVSP